MVEDDTAELELREETPEDKNSDKDVEKSHRKHNNILHGSKPKSIGNLSSWTLEQGSGQFKQTIMMWRLFDSGGNSEQNSERLKNKDRNRCVCELKEYESKEVLYEKQRQKNFSRRCSNTELKRWLDVNSPSNLTTDSCIDESKERRRKIYSHSSNVVDTDMVASSNIDDRMMDQSRIRTRSNLVINLKLGRGIQKKLLWLNLIHKLP
ncbi:MAG: hypothetical protein EZS28_009166 [Streblomastix strix]|uniref:Uncharacterized protein n=1 Tax=Streblomastix strix TaxID=222440 RepID=A0A5J4WKG0_9EUKA|nr:MAG: hypothetical protein EZS28_009166 [Streblomastix strix]